MEQTNTDVYKILESLLGQNQRKPGQTTDPRSSNAAETVYANQATLSSEGGPFQRYSCCRQNYGAGCRPERPPHCEEKCKPECPPCCRKGCKPERPPQCPEGCRPDHPPRCPEGCRPDYPPRCPEGCRPDHPPRCPEGCRPDHPPRCPEGCRPDHPPRCPEGCRPDHPPHCNEKCRPECLPWCRQHPPCRRLKIDNIINCGCNRHDQCRRDDDEADFHSDAEDAGNQEVLPPPEEIVDQEDYTPDDTGTEGYDPDEEDGQQSDFQRDNKCRPDKKDKNIVIENIIECGCKKHDDDDDNESETAYAYLYSLQPESVFVAAGADIPFNHADTLKNVRFTAPQAIIQKSGDYSVNYGVSGSVLLFETQIALAVNGVPISKTYIPALFAPGEYSGNAALHLNEGDVVTLRNVPGGNGLTLTQYPAVGAQLTLHLLN
jgi:hypothetical protein